MAVPEHLCPHRKVFPVSRFSVFLLVTLMLMIYALIPMLFPCLNRAFISLQVYSKTEYSVLTHLLFQELCRCASTFLSSHKPCHQDRQPFSTCIQCQTSVTSGNSSVAVRSTISVPQFTVQCNYAPYLMWYPSNPMGHQAVFLLTASVLICLLVMRNFHRTDSNFLTHIKFLMFL